LFDTESCRIHYHGDDSGDGTGDDGSDDDGTEEDEGQYGLYSFRRFPDALRRSFQYFSM
jgi:hypothetical protein